MDSLREKLAEEVMHYAHWGRDLVEGRSPLPGEHTEAPCASCLYTADRVMETIASHEHQALEQVDDP